MTELDVILKKIRARMNEIADDLATGAARDYSDYKYMTGMINGLAVVERDVLDILERKTDDDEG